MLNTMVDTSGDGSIHGSAVVFNKKVRMPRQLPLPGNQWELLGFTVFGGAAEIPENFEDIHFYRTTLC